MFPELYLIVRVAFPSVCPVTVILPDVEKYDCETFIHASLTETVAVWAPYCTKLTGIVVFSPSSISNDVVI